MPCSSSLGFPGGAKFDALIGGWTQYWNEVLTPDVPLDPNLIKALIASESKFLPTILADKKDLKSARGLMQITDQSRIAMGNIKGELKNHFVSLSPEELDNPNLNICAGIRWLFNKRSLLSKHLKRKATWSETILDYKGVNSTSASKADKTRIKKIFTTLYAKCEKCEK